MELPEVRAITVDEKAKLIDVMLLAFSTDPLARYAMPTASQYLPGMKIVFEGLGAPAFHQGTAYTVGNFSGGAIWIPPGAKASDESIEAVGQYLDPAHAGTFIKVLETMDSHHPVEPHWYLNFVGVDSSKQGEGLGAALMKHALKIVDEAGIVAYLESSNPRNLSLYERFGFETTAKIEIDDCPVVHAMVRKNTR